jgi:streptogramin lyase
MNKASVGALLALATAFTITVTPASAASLSGIVVTSDGHPLLGAMISLFDTEGNRKVTVFSDKEGQFGVDPGFTGAIKLRVRAPYFDDLLQDVTLAADDQLTVKLAVQPTRSKAALSDSLTASAHSAKLHFTDPAYRETFVSQCHYCHQMGNELTRKPRDESEWRGVLDRMENYFAVITPWDKTEFSRTLARDFDGKPIDAVQTHSFSDALARARWEEWQVGDGMSFIHDTDVGSDGHLYGVDQGHDVVWELDRETGKVSEHKMPDIDLPEGGLYSGAELPIGIFTGKHGPHSLVEDETGKFWITGSLASELLSFDIKTKQFELYPLHSDELYPHTIRRARDGMIWFTDPASNEVTRLDPRTKTFTTVQLWHNGFARWLTDALFPYVLKIASLFPKENVNQWISHYWWTGLGRDILNFPYGIDEDPTTGDIWFSKLYANKIGRVDARTLEVTEYDTPLKGPRRLRFDKDGILWIPSFDDGAIMRFDPRTKLFDTYKLPSLAANEYEVPYALNIDPVDGSIWVTTNQSDRILHFDPRTQHFVEYPSPTRVTFLRDLVFTKDHKICASNSNLPAYGIEGGRPVMMCLDPEGAAKTTKSAEAK